MSPRLPDRTASLLLAFCLGLAMLAAARSSFADILQQVSSCVDISKHQGKDLDIIKQNLLTSLQQQAPRVMYAKLYGEQGSQVSPNEFSVDYNDSVGNRLVMQGQPEYYNGDNFGELCVRAWYALPEQQVVTVQAKTVTLKSFCYQEDGLSLQDLSDRARMAGIERLIANMAPGARAPDSYKRKMLEKAKITGQQSTVDASTYCLDISMDVVPLELDLFSPQPKPAAPKTQKASEVKPPDSSLDLSKYRVGDLAPAFGKNIAVYSDVDGKSLGCNLRTGTVAVIPLKGKSDFYCSVLLRKKVAYDFTHSTIIELFTMHYKNQKYEPYSFKITLDSQGLPIAYFRSWTNSTDYFPWTNATNFNDFHIVKKGKTIKLFYNGTFLYTFPAQGDAPVFVRVPLQWDDRLYNVVIYNME